MQSLLSEHLFLLDNVVIWAIFLLAFFCYGLLLDLCTSRRTAHWYQRTVFWAESLKRLLAALPLLGLLGTIAGLLKTFMQMSIDSGLALRELVSGGIGEAMFTTQLGLVMVVPGLIMLAGLNFRKNKWVIDNNHEIQHRTKD